LPIKREILVKRYLEALEANNACIFAGAGLSVQAGFVNWKELLKETCEELDLDISKETDLVAVAQYYVNRQVGNRNRLNQKIMEYFNNNKEPTENHNILARLPIWTYWTTNYDKLLETSLIRAKRNPDIKYTPNHLTNNQPGREAIVYKMHGDCQNPNDAVLTRDDYERYPLKMNDYLSALRGDLINKTFLFLGFSFTDPNIEYILSKVRIAFDKNQRPHYCIMKKVISDGTPDRNYDVIKQNLFINDLKNYGVFTLLVDDYSEITNILEEIEQCHKQRNIFISGSAEIYDYELFNKKLAEQFIYDLSAKIIKEKYRIINGFGLGVGSHVINGALSDIYFDNSNSIKDQLVLRPFPQGIENTEERDSLWNKYRHDMIGKAGIALFIFGNKNGNGGIVPAEGVKKEFQIAQEKGLKVIPVGATGFMSQILWEEVNNSYRHFYPNQTPEFKENFNIIGDQQSMPNNIINAIMKMIKELNKR
jgi:hypothetical protein